MRTSTKFKGQAKKYATLIVFKMLTNVGMLCAPVAKLVSPVS